MVPHLSLLLHNFVSEPCQHYKAEAYVVTLKNAAKSWEDGLLYPIVRKLEAGKCPPDLFSAPLIRAVVWFKWSWAKKVTFFEFLIFLLWLLSFSIHSATYEPEDLGLSISELLNSKNLAIRKGVAYLTSFIAVFFMIPFFYISLCEVIYNGLKHWLTFWNLFDVLAQICQLACFIIFFFGIKISANDYTILLSTCVVLLILKIQYFARQPLFTASKTTSCF